MSQKSRLKNLSNVVDLILDRELAALSVIAGKSDEVHAEISRLDESLSELVHQRVHSKPAETVLFSGRDYYWQDWRRATKMELNSKLAGLKAEQEAQLILTRKAFGRAKAISDIVSKPRS